MNYTDVINTLKKATLFDLYRLSVAIRHEMENPARIQQVRQSFKIGDHITYFDELSNSLQSASVIQKNPKYAVVQNSQDQKIWRIPYYLLNLAHMKVDINAYHREPLTKNHLKVGDCVGFNKDGEEIVGIIIRLNYKTVTLMTKDHHRWRVSYPVLFRVIDADIIKAFDPKQLAQWIAEEKDSARE